MAKAKVILRVEIDVTHIAGPFAGRDDLADELVPEVEAALDGLDVMPYDSEYVVSAVSVSIAGQ
jgi:hypothetical protein